MRPSAPPTTSADDGRRSFLLGLAGRALAELQSSVPDGELLEALEHPQLRNLGLRPGDSLYVGAFDGHRQLLLIGRLDVGPGSGSELAASGPHAIAVDHGRRVPHDAARALEGGGRGLRFAKAATYELHPAALMKPVELDADSAGLLDALLPEPRARALKSTAPASDLRTSPSPVATADHPASVTVPPPSARPPGDPREVPLWEALPSRVVTALRREGFETLGDLQALAPEQLDAMRGVGASAARAVRARLAADGIAMSGTGQLRGGRAGLPPSSFGSPAPAPIAKPPSARTQAMAQLRAQGHTLEQIGRRFSVTREAVRQAIRKHGGMSADSVREARKQQEAAAVDEHAQVILSAYREGRGTDAIADSLGLPRGAVRQYAGERASAADRATRTKAMVDASAGRGKSFTDQQLVDAVIKVADRLGRTPTAAEYGYHARRLGLPSVPTIQNRMGWTGAIEAAGLVPLSVPRREYSRQWTEEACWAAMRKAVAELGKIPTVQEYEAHVSGRSDLPSQGTIRNRLGRWSAVCLALASEQPSTTPELAGPSPVLDRATGRPRRGFATSEVLRPGEVWTRQELCDRFGILDATIRTGIFHPAGHDSVWLFVTRDKTAEQTQYKDELVGDVLAWEGQMAGRKDRVIIEHAQRGLELLLFYRTSKTEHPGAGFIYHGPFAYEHHKGSRPTSFVLRRMTPLAPPGTA